MGHLPLPLFSLQFPVRCTKPFFDLGRVLSLLSFSRLFPHHLTHTSVPLSFVATRLVFAKFRFSLPTFFQADRFCFHSHTPSYRSCSSRSKSCTKETAARYPGSDTFKFLSFFFLCQHSAVYGGPSECPSFQIPHPRRQMGSPGPEHILTGPPNRPTDNSK